MIRTVAGMPRPSASKPRASGDDPPQYAINRSKLKVNPARAGMIRQKTPAALAAVGKPRASGDDPTLFIDLPGEKG